MFFLNKAWEQYALQIGTQDGPLLYEIDETDSNYPHLNGFVPFDMEYWWAERSISSMINENVHNTNVQHSNSNQNEYKQNSVNVNTLVLTNCNHFQGAKSENNNKNQNVLNFNTNMTPSAMSIASFLISSSKSKYNASLSKSTTSLKPFNITNNLQLCFS